MAVLFKSIKGKLRATVLNSLLITLSKCILRSTQYFGPFQSTVFFSQSKSYCNIIYKWDFSWIFTSWSMVFFSQSKSYNLSESKGIIIWIDQCFILNYLHSQDTVLREASRKCDSFSQLQVVGTWHEISLVNLKFQKSSSGWWFSVKTGLKMLAT